MADTLDGLITAIYEASLDASAWEGVGLLLPQAFKGDGCLIQRRDLATRTATLFTVKGMDGINWRDYEQYYCQHDLWALGAGRRPLNGAYHFHELVAPDTYERSEIYNDYLRPPCDVDIFWGMGTLLSIDSTTV